MSKLLGQDLSPCGLCVLRMVCAAVPTGNPRAAGVATERSLSPPFRDLLGVGSVVSPLSHPSLAFPARLPAA